MIETAPLLIPPKKYLILKYLTSFKTVKNLATLTLQTKSKNLPKENV